MARFTAVLSQEETPTGDGRIFDAGAFTWRDLPLPLNWLKEDAHGGTPGASFTVGMIDTIERVGTDVVGSGDILEDSEHGAAVIPLLRSGAIRGVSIDFDDIEVEFVEQAESNVVSTSEPVMIHHKARIMGATIVAFPAFPGALITLDEEKAMPEDDIKMNEPMETAAVKLHPRLAKLVNSISEAQDEVPSHAAEESFAPDEEEELEEETSLADDVDALRSALSGDADALESLDRVAAAAGIEPKEADEMDTLIASSAPTLPPKSWFENPGLSSSHPITVEKSGRVYGHIASWDTCHTAIPGCEKPPKSASNYAYFRTGTVLTAEDVQVPVGNLTMHSGHADLALNPAAAKAHYDNTSTAIADVNIGEDEFGIWVASTLR